jgi:hypothetical protein
MVRVVEQDDGAGLDVDEMPAVGRAQDVRVAHERGRTVGAGLSGVGL